MHNIAGAWENGREGKDDEDTNGVGWGKKEHKAYLICIFGWESGLVDVVGMPRGSGCGRSRGAD